MILVAVILGNRSSPIRPGAQIPANFLYALSVLHGVEKVILATDADVDGMCPDLAFGNGALEKASNLFASLGEESTWQAGLGYLMITYSFRFFEQPIHDGHVHVLETPLFRVSNKEKTIYCFVEGIFVESSKSVPPSFKRS